MKRIRTINEAVKEIKIADESSAINANMIRQLCKEGKLPYYEVGNRILIDVDEVLEFFG